MVDKPAAVAKAPFCQEVERIQHADTLAISKRNSLTLAKDSIAGIISGIIALAGGMSSRRLHDGERWRMREVGSSPRLRSLHFPPTPTARCGLSLP
jgi:hypothetical protein